LVRHVYIGINSPYVPIRVKFEPTGPELEVEALIDTGFDGHVSMPSVRLPLALLPTASHLMSMADGSMRSVNVYKGTAQIIGLDQAIAVRILLGTSDVLVGRRFTDHFRVTFDHGREVIVEP
jgi:predicted aspartyl protease